MESSLKYRTQGSLPIGRQSYSEYIPKTPEPKPNNHVQMKQDFVPPRRPVEDKQPPPPPPPKPKLQMPAPPVQKPALPVQTPAPPVQVPAQIPAPPEQNKRQMPPYDPCKAIIETSPYYVYFKIMTKPDAKHPVEEDVRMMLNQLVVVDKDMPKTAKYRNFRTYVE